MEGGEITTSPVLGANGTLPLGEAVVITAHPKDGYVFFAWSGVSVPDASQNPIAITVAKDHDVSAFFRFVGTRSTPTLTPTPTPVPISRSTPTPTFTASLASPVDLVTAIANARPSIVRIITNIATGSGAIFEVDQETGRALVLTNQHVIDRASSIRVEVNDSDNYVGMVVGVDNVRDLAVISICCDINFESLAFGDASNLPPGTMVIAMGYPLGIAGQATVTSGIVSAVRFVSSAQRWVIQTDAAINSGNSGGPLLSKTGELLGINTFVVREAGGGVAVEGFGFAVSGVTIQGVLPGLTSINDLGSASTPTPTRSSTSLSAGSSGSILHVDDGQIDGQRDRVDLENPMVEATFTNPYANSEAGWDYGFLLRLGRVNEFHAIIVTSDGFWVHDVRTGTYQSSEQVDTGFSSSIRTMATESNQIRVIVQGDVGWLFINGSYITALDLSDLTGSGDVWLFTGYFAGNSIAGRSTHYEQYGVTAVTAIEGPSIGQLEHREGLISRSLVATSVTNVMLEAQFTNPYATSIGSWDYGFSFRIFHRDNADFEDSHTVILESDGRWVHFLSTGSLESSGTIDHEYTSFDTSTEGSNRLRVIAIDDTGWLFINGNLSATLDLSAITEPGALAAITGLFKSDKVPGHATSYEEFTVWKLE